MHPRQQAPREPHADARAEGPVTELPLLSRFAQLQINANNEQAAADDSQVLRLPPMVVPTVPMVPISDTRNDDSLGWIEVGYPRICALNPRDCKPALVYKFGYNEGLTEGLLSECYLHAIAEQDSSFRVARIPLRGTRVEILQRDVYPPEEQAAFAHRRGQRNVLVVVMLSLVQLFTHDYLYITTRKWHTWECDDCKFRNKYDAARFRGAACFRCGHSTCKACRIDTTEEIE